MVILSQSQGRRSDGDLTRSGWGECLIVDGECVDIASAFQPGAHPEADLVDSSTHRLRAARVGYIHDLHSVGGLARHDGVSADADGKCGDASSARERGESVVAVCCTTCRHRVAWVAHVDELQATRTVIEAHHDSERAGADGERRDAERPLEFGEYSALTIVDRTAH
eukprot:scaffold115485_cov51-Phaeocystis_antarctica.AAC.2